MSDLRTIVRIKHMAEAAARVAEQPGPEEGHEMAAAYERLRAEAFELYRRAGWGDDEETFARQVPVLEAESLKVRGPGRVLSDASLAYEAAAGGHRARVLLSQLAAWAAGHQETFEVEERLKADAAARAAQGSKGAAGFR